MQLSRTITLFCIVKALLPFVILKFCPEPNINTIRYRATCSPFLISDFFKTPSFIPGLD